MKSLGIALTDGAFGGSGADQSRPVDVAPFSNLYICWCSFGYWKGGETPDQANARMALCLKRIPPLNMDIFVVLNMNDPADATTEALTKRLKIIAPYWLSVTAIMLADEASWTKQQAKANLRKVRGLLSSLRLSQKPLGLGFTIEQSTGVVDDASGGQAITITKSAGLDFAAIECFVDHHLQDQGQAKNLASVTNTVTKSRARMAPGVKVYLWLQAFNRNGAFPNETNLAALIWPSYLLGRDDPKGRTEGYLAYNWNRSTSPTSFGARKLPLVTAQLKRVWADIEAKA